MAPNAAAARSRRRLVLERNGRAYPKDQLVADSLCGAVRIGNPAARVEHILEVRLYREQGLALDGLLHEVRQANVRVARLGRAMRAAVPDWSLVPLTTASTALRIRGSWIIRQRDHCRDHALIACQFERHGRFRMFARSTPQVDNAVVGEIKYGIGRSQRRKHANSTVRRSFLNRRNAVGFRRSLA
jgi:hypothetical protein